MPRAGTFTPFQAESTMKIAFFVVMILSSVSLFADQQYSLYLVRHAEKDLSDHSNRDPALTACGHSRAKRLATLLQAIPLQAVYSSDYKRTQATAQPVATAKGLSVESYDPFKLKQLQSLLQQRKQSALVVGHSQTTSVLAGMLAQLELKKLSEDQYDRLYQVLMSGDKVISLNLLYQAFDCQPNKPLSILPLPQPNKGKAMNNHEKLNYVEFPARDLSASKRFFSSVFGWDFVDYGPDYAAFTGQGLDGGFFQSDQASHTDSGGALLVFYSSNIGQTLAKVQQHGGQINRPIFDFPGGCRFHFIDPSGNEFAVWSEQQ